MHRVESDKDRDGWVAAYIGLGSNLGDRELALRQSLDELGRCEGVEVVKVSPFIETEPVGGPPQGKFLNAAAELRTNLDVRSLLEKLHEVERRFGRVRAERWGPRTLDIDLLLYDNLVLDSKEVTVPHPRMHLRSFVLEPLSEIAPQAMHPVLGKTISELVRGLRTPA